jgi:hypothetical protein
MRKPLFSGFDDLAAYAIFFGHWGFTLDGGNFPAKIVDISE